jgi:dTDP-4-dehydrorhamnose 3,5-epimerase
MLCQHDRQDAYPTANSNGVAPNRGQGRSLEPAVKVHQTEIPGMLLFEPRVFADARGYFLETYNQQRYQQAGLVIPFVQDNVSHSVRGTLRGLHYQIVQPQGKLCSVLSGEVYDVTVDLRRGSPAFGRWVAYRLSESNHRQVYVPPGCAHGFCVLSDVADFLYKCTDFYSPQHERTILWNDPQLAIQWPIEEPRLSEKDRAGRFLEEAEVYEGVIDKPAGHH